MANKIIISCAITGSIHTPTMSDALPITPDQIATQAIDAAEAGAAILHLHARDPKDGRPTPDPERIHAVPAAHQAGDRRGRQHHHRRRGDHDGGAAHLAAPLLSPEMCSLNMGSMNFALYPMARRFKDWKYDWEESYLTNSDDLHLPAIRFATSRRSSKLLGEGHGVKFEHECYDIGHLYNLAHFIDRGMFKPPVFVQLIFGILGGIGADLDNLLFMKRTADRLFGDEYYWSVLAGGRHQMNFGTNAAMMGGNVRVGLEDSLYIGRASWPRAMPSRWRRSAGSSRSSVSRLRRRPRRAKRSASRAPTA